MVIDPRTPRMNTEKLVDIVNSMVNNAVQQYVTPGLTSYLVGGAEHGKVRLFSSDRDTREWVTPHSHRFNFACLVLQGHVENILFEEYYGDDWQASNSYAKGVVRRDTNDAFGKYEVLRPHNIPKEYEEKTTVYKAGDAYSMTAYEIHSIRFSRDCQVLFFEGPEVVDHSVFLEPFSNGRVIQTFETKDWMFDRSESSAIVDA